MAVNENVPVAVGVQVAAYGNVVSEPSETPLAKNCTLAIVFPAPTAAAFAVMVWAALTATAEPVVGALIVTVGALPPATVTATFAEVVVAPRLSVATAVSTYEPATVGVQEILYGAVESVPIETGAFEPFATKNWTLAIEPSVSAAVAVTVVATPTPTVAPPAGAVTLTVGAEFAATVTVTAVLMN